MANFAYPVSSIIGGVSNLEYAIRMDSQATDQENCLLSPKYGLCKRPNSHYLATIKNEDADNNSNLDCIIHPLHYGSDERILVGFQKETGDATGSYVDSHTENWTLYDNQGLQNVINHYPGSTDATVPAIGSYSQLAVNPATGHLAPPKYLSLATHGDYTFIAHAHVEPQMQRTTWVGYNETYSFVDSSPSQTVTRTILNDECYAVWIKAHQVGVQKYQVVVNHDGTLLTAHCTTDKDDSSSKGTYSTGLTDLKNDTKYIAGYLGYAISNGTTHEATSLATAVYSPDAFGGASYDCGQGGTSVVTGRIFDDLDVNGNTGVNFEPSLLHSVKVEAGRSEGNVTVAHRTCPSVQQLPPRSWEDHTVEITDVDNDGGDTFYMRFVNDEDETITYSQNGTSNDAFSPSVTFGTDAVTANKSTTKLPRSGHWQEHCGVGVETDINTSTMPHFLFKRKDGSFLMMEGRGSFQINTVDTTLDAYLSNNTLKIDIDAGFSDDGATIANITSAATGGYTSALIVGDTVKLVKSSGSTGTFPPELKEDHEYFIKAVGKAAREYSFTLSETDGGPVINITTDRSLSDVQVILTSYEHDSWAQRSAGDNQTNPLPDIFYRKINQLFVYQNRLGFCSDKEVYFSASGDPFSLFRSTVRDLIESDPFGVSPADSKGDIVKAAASYGQHLVVFTNEAQHIVRALDGKFSAKSVEIVNATHATCDFNPMPASVGESLFFTYSTSDFGGVWEFVPSNVRTNVFVAADISNQIPAYLPAGARVIDGSSKHRMLFYLNERPIESKTNLTDDTSHVDYGKDQNIYVYHWLDGPDGGRKQTAWTKWRFNADNETGHTSAEETATGYRIVNLAVISDRIYMVTSTKSLNNGGGGTYNTEFYLEYVDLDIKTQDTLISTTLKGNFDSCQLDRRTKFIHAAHADTADTQIPTGNVTYSGGTSTIVMPWKYDTAMKDSIEIVTSSGTRYSTANPKLTVNAPTAGAGCTVTLETIDLTGINWHIGFGYTMSSTFGPFAPTVNEKPLRGRNVYVRGGRLTYTQANEFTIDVVQGGTTYTETISAGTETDTISGEQYFGIRNHMPSLSYTLKNETPWNALFQGMMYDLNIQEVMGRG